MINNKTDSIVISNISSSIGSGLAFMQLGTKDYFRPVVKNLWTTSTSEFDMLDVIGSPTGYEPKKKFEPPLTRLPLPASADSTPIQIWEGTVIEVDHEEGAMQVLLDAKMGEIPRHTADIDLEWVADQDKDLLLPGAVFYLTLFKRTKRGSIENSQELRFRRRPSWSSEQLEQVKRDADMLLSKMKPPLPAK